MKIGDKLLAIKGFKSWDSETNEVGISAGTLIEYLGIFQNRKNKHELYKNLSTGKTFIFLNGKKVIPYKEGDQIPEFKKSTVGYKIKYNGAFLKSKKFKDLGKIKTSLLIEFGYYDKLNRNADKNKNPELIDMDIPYWFEGGENISLEEFKNVEIVCIEKKQECVVDFNAYEYIKDSQLKLDAICKYGWVVKEMFSKLKDDKDFKYYITITPVEYNKFSELENRERYKILRDIRNMEENPIIKESLKKLGFKPKDYKKITKCGKTAIAVNNEENLLKLMDEFNDFNIDVFATTNDRLIEYNKLARRLSIISKL
jgi:hypothetical protein